MSAAHPFYFMRFSRHVTPLDFCDTFINKKKWSQHKKTAFLPNSRKQFGTRCPPINTAGRKRWSRRRPRLSRISKKTPRNNPPRKRWSRCRPRFKSTPKMKYKIKGIATGVEQIVTESEWNAMRERGIAENFDMISQIPAVPIEVKAIAEKAEKSAHKE